jgi:hypothetical protein
MASVGMRVHVFLAAGDCATLERESKLDVKTTSDSAEFLLFDLP